MAVGLVVVLRRRRVAIALPQLRVLAEHALQQQPEVRLLDRGDQLADLPLHLLDAACRAIEQIIHGKGSGLGRLQATQIDLRTEARVDGIAAAHPHGRPGAGQLLDLGELLPDHACERPRAVAQRQAQVLAAVAALAALGLAHQQNLIDLHAVCELVDEHVLKVDGGADETRRGAPGRVC
jgi:hypothetical protein